MEFIPNKDESVLISIIQEYIREEFALIRMTYTMLDKSTIDASENIRYILSNNCKIEYNQLERGVKYYNDSYILSKSGVTKRKTSFYHPNAKGFRKSYGDPRFWIYGFKKEVTIDTLIYFTTFNMKLVAIPLVDHVDFESNLKKTFGDNREDLSLINELLSKVSVIRSRGWIESISPYNIVGNIHKSSPKDAGETFEKLLDIKPNSSQSADFFGEIELKSKRVSGNSNNTLFSKVPDWNLSGIKSAREMILTYGYPARKTKYLGFKDLYVTVTNKPNNQGLYLLADNDSNLLHQYHTDHTHKSDTAIWTFNSLREKLFQKHKQTLWVSVEEKIINDKIYFKYTKCELTKKPIFSQFTSLINQGIVTYDWRGRVKLDGSGYNDKGHAFRISEKNRHLLFGESVVVDFSNY